jgi:hypothetical protein
MREGPRIYNLFPLMAGPLPRWRPHLERAAARFRPQTGLRAAHGPAVTDPLTATSRTVPGDAEVELVPSGILLVHPAPEAGRAGSAS